MTGELRSRLVPLGTVVLTLAVSVSGAPVSTGEYAAAALLLAVAFAAAVAAVALHVRVVPSARIDVVALAQWGRSRRLYCPVVTPRDPACPRAPGIG